MMSAHATNTQLYQRKLLHDEVPVTRVEFMDMLCDELRLPKTLATYASFTNLCFEFGQSFTCSDGKTFWATDSRYPYSNEKGQRMRRDRFSIEGSSKQTYRLTDGRRVERLNSLCGEATCFVTVHNLQAIEIPAMDHVAYPVETFPDLHDLRSEVRDNSITFFLIRWFEPHEDSHERDQRNRPICPGPLHINHCLWSYAKTDITRPSLPRSASNWTRVQKYAYYGLIFPSNVLELVNMTPVFLRDSVEHGNDWLETVTVI